MTERELKDLVLEIDINVPRQKVWDEITSTGRIQKALYNTVLETDLTPGARLRYYSPNKKRVFVVGEVVEVSPPYTFSHTYMFVQRSEEPTLVTWTLEEIPTGCRVKIVHSGFTNQVKTYDSSGGGWKEILAILKADLETGVIPLKIRVMYSLMNVFMFMMPKSTTIEEVEKAGW